MEIFYTKDHEWLKIDGNTYTLGITGYAAEHLGDITYIELPQTGLALNQGEILCEIESVKAASDVYVPMTGTVTDINADLEASPDLINSSPEQDGWIARLEISNETEQDSLMSADQYKEYLQTLE
jgi:glycine cleavage system H protein